MRATTHDRSGEAAPRLDGWRLERCLGRGRTGAVHLARSTSEPDRWAAVRLCPGLRGENERESIARLTAAASPWVVPVREVVDLTASTDLTAPGGEGLAGVVGIVEGGTLAAYAAARGPLSPGELATALTPIAWAAADLEAAGIAHGFIGLRRVLLTRSGRPVLGDLLGALAHRRRVGAGPASPASDVAALGACAWELLTGAAPAAPGRRVPLADARPDLPGEVAEILTACLRVDPARRPRAGDVAAALLDSLTPEPLEPPGDDPDRAPTRRIPERFLRTTSTAAADSEAAPETGETTTRRRPPPQGPDDGASRRDRNGPQSSNEPLSRRFFRADRKRPASAPSTTRWS